MSLKSNKEDRSSVVVIRSVRAISMLLGKILWRIKYHGNKNIPASTKGGLIIAANHQTYLDPFLIGAPIKFPLRFMAWDKPFRWRIVDILLRALGAFPVSLNKGGTISALKESVAILKADGSLVIFPEGSREFSDGKHLEFKTGAVRIALETNTPILPVTIKGANRVWSQDHSFPRLGKIEVHYHPLFYASEGNAGEDLDCTVVSANNELKRIIGSV